MYQPGTKSFVLNELHVLFQEVAKFEDGDGVGEPLITGMSAIGKCTVEEILGMIEEVRDNDEPSQVVDADHDPGYDEVQYVLLAPGRTIHSLPYEPPVLAATIITNQFFRTCQQYPYKVTIVHSGQVQQFRFSEYSNADDCCATIEQWLQRVHKDRTMCDRCQVEPKRDDGTLCQSCYDIESKNA